MEDFNPDEEPQEMKMKMKREDEEEGDLVGRRQHVLTFAT